MSALALAVLAGVLTTGNPCVLPLLPLVMASTLAGGRLGPIAFAGGMVTAFVVVGVGVLGLGHLVGVTSDMVRAIAALVLIAFGVVMLVPKLQDRFALATAGLANGAQSLSGRVASDNPGGAFVIGALSGALWSPCAGPSLGAALTLAASADGTFEAAARMLAFALGAASVLVALAYGSRAAIHTRRDLLMALSTRGKPILGGLLVATGLAVATGFDKRVEAVLVDLTPAWLSTVTTGI